MYIDLEKQMKGYYNIPTLFFLSRLLFKVMEETCCQGDKIDGEKNELSTEKR